MSFKFFLRSLLRASAGLVLLLLALPAVASPRLAVKVAPTILVAVWQQH